MIEFPVVVNRTKEIERLQSLIKSSWHEGPKEKWYQENFLDFLLNFTEPYKIFSPNQN